MSKTKILIVEDDMIIAEDLSSTLKKAGYAVSGCFDNGKDAMESFMNDTPDLVFMDISIPGEDDGIETAKKLKSQHPVPVIFLTNIYNPDTIQRANSANPANYLIKPFTTNQIVASISTALFNFSQQKPADIRETNRELHDDHALSITKDHFFIRNLSGTFVKYHVSDILFIEADRTYCKIHLSNGDELVQSTNMKDMHQKIRHPLFFKANRSFVINIDKIDSIKGNLAIIGKHEIKMTPEFAEDIQNKLRIVR